MSQTADRTITEVSRNVVPPYQLLNAPTAERPNR